MTFHHETGAILSPQKTILHLVEGTAGMVIFPQETTWNLHKSSPGSVYGFSHVHPDGMSMLSSEDESTLKAWVMAFYPYPMRLITITHMKTNSSYPYDGARVPTYEEFVFRETCYLGLMEAKETWETHKEQKRKFEIIKEWERDFFITDPKSAMNDWYGLVLIRKSYTWDDLGVN